MSNQIQKKLENLKGSGILEGALNGLGGIGGMAESAGYAFIQNQHHIIAGIKSLEEKHKELLEKDGFEGLCYMLANAKVKGEDKVAIILFPYRGTKDNEVIRLECGSSIAVYDLNTFIQMVIRNAKNLKPKKNGTK